MIKPPEQSPPLVKIPLPRILSLRQIVDTIVDGHAQKKHLHKFARTDISTPERLKEYLMEILPSDGLECFSTWHHQPKSGADFFYHAEKNIYGVFPYTATDEPTTFPPDIGRQKFEDKYRKAIVNAKDAGLILPPIKIHRGIYSLHPDLRIKEIGLLNNAFSK